MGFAVRPNQKSVGKQYYSTLQLRTMNTQLRMIILCTVIACVAAIMAIAANHMRQQEDDYERRERDYEEIKISKPMGRRMQKRCMACNKPPSILEMMETPMIEMLT